MSNASMLDEVQPPPEPVLLICPCCKFGFNDRLAFTHHLNLMKAQIDAALKKVGAPTK